MKANHRGEREKRRVLFAIRLVPYAAIQRWSFLDPISGNDLAREVDKFFIPDFTNWTKPDAYESV